MYFFFIFAHISASPKKKKKSLALSNSNKVGWKSQTKCNSKVTKLTRISGHEGLAGVGWGVK